MLGYGETYMRAIFHAAGRVTDATYISADVTPQLITVHYERDGQRIAVQVTRENVANGLMAHLKREILATP